MSNPNQAPDTPFLVGPNFGQTTASGILVTPLGGSQTTLAAALAAGGGLTPIPALNLLANASGGSAIPGPVALDATLLFSGSVLKVNPSGQAFVGGTADNMIIGGTTPAIGNFTNVNFTGSILLNGASFASWNQSTLSMFQGIGAGPNSTGNFNTFSGYNAGNQNTTGGENSFFGNLAGAANISGNFITAVGQHALGFSQTASGETMFGNDTGRNLFSTTGENTAVGHSAMHLGGAGNNTAIGSGAMSGNSNAMFLSGTVTASDVLSVVVTASGIAGSPITLTVPLTGLTTLAQVATAIAAAYTNNSAISQGGQRSATVYDTQNVVFGGIGSSAAGDQCVITCTGQTTEVITITNGMTGSPANVAVGYQTMTNKYATTASQNVAVGSNAMQFLTTGANNTGIGTYALQALTSGTANFAGGWSALIAATTAFNNVAVGFQSGLAIVGAGVNTLVGWTSGKALVGGNFNTLIGGAAGAALVGSNSNVAVGYQALTLSVSGVANVAIGQTALSASATTGSYQVAIGAQAMSTWNAASSAANASNVAIGAQTFNGTAASGTNAVVIGGLAGTAMTSASNIVVIGTNAGKLITTGGSNVVIGPAVASTTLVTGTGNILIGLDTSTDTAASGTSNTVIIKGANPGVAVLSATATNGTPQTLLGGNVWSTLSLGVGGLSGPTWTSGAGAPASVTPNGSIYSNTTGTVGARLYVSNGATWTAVAAV